MDVVELAIASLKTQVGKEWWELWLKHEQVLMQLD